MRDAIGTKWHARRQEIADLILHDGWLTTDLAEYFGVSREYARCIVRQLAIPYSATKVVRLWCVWKPAVRPCVDCGRPTYPQERNRGQCYACCGKRRRREWTPEQREAHKQQVYRWRAENSENARDVTRRAVKAYQERKRAAGLCRRCDQPLATKWYCAQHTAEHNARQLARYNARKARAGAAA